MNLRYLTIEMLEQLTGEEPATQRWATDPLRKCANAVNNLLAAARDDVDAAVFEMRKGCPNASAREALEACKKLSDAATVARMMADRIAQLEKGL